MELWQHTALELARLVAARVTSCREVVQAHLDRVEAVERGPLPVGAVVRLLADEALAAADVADRAVAAGARLGPLHGVPCTVKENIDVAGTPTTDGAATRADAVVDRDAPVVERLRAAGAVPVARTNLPDLGLRVTTSSSLHGTTRNPWDADRSAGGSSGGEAAAIATGMSPLGLGNDLGGSLRNPAHCCGVASVKPGTGVVPAASASAPRDPSLAWQLLAVQGVLARRVADVRAGLLAVAGQHPRDPWSVPGPPPAHDPDRRLRVALLAAPPGGPTHAGVARAVRRAGDVLADAGHDVVDATPPRYEEAVARWREVLAPDLRARRAELVAAMGPDGARVLDATLAGMPDPAPADVHATHVARHAIARAWAEWHATHDVLVQPAWSHPAPPEGFDLPGARHRGVPPTGQLLRTVLPANLLGLPVATVPVGLVDRVPVAAQVQGPRASELRCLAVAEELEAALGLRTPIDPRPAGGADAA